MQRSRDLGARLDFSLEIIRIDFHQTLAIPLAPLMMGQNLVAITQGSPRALLSDEYVVAAAAYVGIICPDKRGGKLIYESRASSS
jgi:hypothetical protein